MSEYGFYHGVFAAIEYLVLVRDEPTLAAELAKEHGIGAASALLMADEAGHERAQMLKFIADYLSEEK